MPHFTQHPTAITPALLEPSRSKSGSTLVVLGARVSPPAMKKETAKSNVGDPGAPGRAPKSLDCNRDAPKQPKGWHHRGYLPHFDDQTKIQTITYRLADSLPQKLLQRLANELENPDGDIAYRQRMEDHLDRGYGSCCLKNPEIAKIVIDSWLKFDAVRYDIFEYVVMPNHVHLLMAQRENHVFADIIKGFKSFTAREINRKLGRKGQLWQEDYWGRYIRNTRHFEAATRYIHENPVKAGLIANASDWPWSSANKASPLGPRVSSPATKKGMANIDAGEDTRAPNNKEGKL